MSEAPSESTPLWRQRARKLRLALLLLVLVGVFAVLGLRRFPLLSPTRFVGELALDHGVRVERLDLPEPACQLVLARIPRRGGLGLRALLLNPEQQELQRIGRKAGELSALVAINGDYHRTGGFCFATTYSTLVDGGKVAVLGSPFSYAASFWLDQEGKPQAGRLDLRCVAKTPSGEFELYLNLDRGPALLIDRPPSGSWSGGGYLGVEVSGSFAAGEVRVSGPLSTAWRGPALLAKVGGKEEKLLRKLKPGDAVQLKLVGKHAGKVALAIGTGPRLLAGGEVHPDAKLQDSGWLSGVGRTAIGFNADELILATTPQEPRGGLSMLKLALALKALGCREAVNLDGGPSSTLWATNWRGGRVLNIPLVQGDPEVASALYVVAPGAGSELR